MIHFEPLQGPHYLSGGHFFTNLESTLSDDPGTEMSQIVAFLQQFFRRSFKPFPKYFYFKL